MENYASSLPNLLCCFLDIVFVICQIPFIAMYRKEMCPSLLRDPDSNDEDNKNLDSNDQVNKNPDSDDQDKKKGAPKMRWHKVSIIHQILSPHHEYLQLLTQFLCSM